MVQSEPLVLWIAYDISSGEVSLSILEAPEI